jgi:hypothetical protein
MILLHTKFHTPNSRVSLAIFISPNVDDIGMATMLLFYQQSTDTVTEATSLG